MQKKALIFDLDDTLCDTFTQIKTPALKAAVQAMQKAGLPCDLEQGVQDIMHIVTTKPREDYCLKLAKKYGKGEAIAKIGRKTVFEFPVSALKPNPEIKETLKKLQKVYDLYLITTGIPSRQKEKVQQIEVEKFFTACLFDEGGTKRHLIEAVLKISKRDPKAMFVIGDRIDKEIRFGNEFGMYTIRMLKGNYAQMQPAKKIDEPQTAIKTITELPKLLQKIEENEKKEEEQRTLKVVNIGGGTAQPIMLKGLKTFTKKITALVAVTDAGGSSKIMREDIGIPPGDIQKCLVGLAKDEKLLNELFLFRFKKGYFQGHTFGNMFIAALTEKTGSIEQAIIEASKILNVQGQVLPSSLSDLHLYAELTDGTKLTSEPEVESKARGKVEELSLSNPDAPANPLAVDSIMDADIVLIGPGSLYSSILPNILIKEIQEALAKTKARIIYVCNIVTQPGETDNMSAKDHIQEIEKYLGKGVLDYAIVNGKIPDADLIDRYKKEDSEVLSLEGLDELSVKIICEDVIRDEVHPDEIHETAHLLRHDPQKIIDVFMSLLDK